jgi:hypothetical protein
MADESPSASARDQEPGDDLTPAGSSEKKKSGSAKQKTGVPKIPQTAEKVKVIVRCRPISKKEVEQGHVP